MIKLILNLLTILGGTVIGLLIGECFFYFDGRYESQINQKFQPANTIYKRYANLKEFDYHPDLEIALEHNYDKYAVKNHYGVDIKELNEIVGFFGDSFTENRRVSDEFTFVSQIRKFLNKNNVINFGVDAFGIEQSLQRYLNFENSVDFEKIVYVFCENDLRNLYEVQLFESLPGGKLVNKFENGSVVMDRNPAINILSKVRLTYFALEVYLILQSRWHETANKSLAERLKNRTVHPGRSDHLSRFLDPYALSINTDLMSKNPSSNTVALAKRFLLILDSWNKLAQENGHEFYLAVLPRYLDRKIFQSIKSYDNNKVLGKINFFYLPQAHEVFPSSNYSSRFSGNDHWNEIGNLAATGTFLKEVFFLDDNTKETLPIFMEEKITEIEDYYRQYSMKPRFMLQEPDPEDSHLKFNNW